VRRRRLPMKIINTDGMVFIGPGSEWLWTMISGLVLAVTFLAIYWQLRLQQHAGAIEQLRGLEREWGSERLSRYRLEVLEAYEAKADPASVSVFAFQRVREFWEATSGLARRGHLNRDLLATALASDCLLWWMTLQPWVMAEKKTAEKETKPHSIWKWRPRTRYQDFDWLRTLMAKMSHEAGLPTYDTAESIEPLTRQRISGNRELIRVEEALRTVIIASPDAVTAPSAPAAAPWVAPAVAEG
jgi:hypothetical protein